MTISLPTASHHELASHCAYPWSGGLRWPERAPRTPSQRFGDAFHFLAGELAQGQPAVLADYADAFDLTAGDLRQLAAIRGHVEEVLAHDDAGDALTRAGAAVEIGVGYALATGHARVLRDRDDRLDEPEVRGWADLAFRRRGGRLVVRDWKTGHRARVYRPESNRQLRFLAMAMARVFGDDAVTVELAHVDEDGILIAHADLDALDLAAIEGEQLDLAARVEASRAPVPGPWCERSYCPVRAVCPATRSALATVADALTAHPMTGELTSAEHAAFVRHRLPVLQAWIDQRQRDVEEYARRNGPIPVEGAPGVLWGPIEHDGRETLTATPEAMAVMEARLGTAAAAVAIERSISKASIERGARATLGSRPARGALKAAVEPLLAELRALPGAAKRGSKYVRFEEFRRFEEKEESR